MPEASSPRAKRAVPAARGVAARPRRARAVVEDTGVNYALRMTEALDAISLAQAPVALQESAPRSSGRAGFGAPKPTAPAARKGASLSDWLKRLDKLPPIRLPIGPAIPWRVGVPVLVALVAITMFVARPMAQGGAPASRLPTPQTYPVEQQAPLFADAQPTPAPTPVPAPLGVADPGGVGFDVVDVGLKLLAVLALAYGSLVLLKRAGLGGAAVATAGKSSANFQVVSSLTLAPNRTVHLLKVPGGKTVLVGATPNQVNLIADLGELAEDLESDAAGSFFDVLKGKISS